MLYLLLTVIAEVPTARYDHRNAALLRTEWLLLLLLLGVVDLPRYLVVVHMV